MLEKHRDWASARMDLISSPFDTWNPNTLSWLSFGLSCVAALFFFGLRIVPQHSVLVPIFFFEAASCVFAGGVFDALDGHVARKQGLTSNRGDYLDHVLDRYADTAILVGIAFSGWANPYLGLFALVSLLLSSYLGTQAQAVTGKRLYGGLLGRADRIVLVSVFALGMFVLTVWNYFAPASSVLKLSMVWLGLTWGPLDVLLLYFIFAGQATSAFRAIHTWRTLGPV